MRLVYVCILWLVAGLAFAQEIKAPSYAEVDPSVRDLGPQGFVRIKKRYFVQQCETSLSEWMAFMKAHEYPKHQRPDTSVWKNSPWAGLSKTYLSDTNADLPIVGVSLSQVEEYCAWKSREESEKINAELAKKGSEWRIYVHLRLPSEEEWKQLASGKGAEHKAGKQAKNDKKLASCCLCLGSAAMNQAGENPFLLEKLGLNKTNPAIFPYSKVQETQVNCLQIKGLNENISEMLHTSRTAIGCSYNSGKEGLKSSGSFSFGKSAANVGFRCIAEIHYYKKDGNPILEPIED